MDKKTKEKVDKLTGAVDVNGDVTPTLREKITRVKSNDWANMSIADLWEQRMTLAKRLVYAQQTAHPEIARQIQAGLNTIDQIIESREPESDGRLY